MSWFKQWFGTRYYALLYGHRDAIEADAWVDAIIDRWKLPTGAHVVDLGCGRGRHARRFVERGYKATGLDISADSISEARCSVGGADFRVQDMREPFGRETYDAACCLFTSLGYWERKEDDARVFDNICQALRPGGRFVLDFMNAPLILRDLVEHETVERDGLRFLIHRSAERDVLVKRITVHDGASEHRFEERVQALGPDELESMATGAGLEVEDLTDGPMLSPFDPDRSQRFVLWARKPHA